MRQFNLIACTSILKCVRIARGHSRGVFSTFSVNTKQFGIGRRKIIKYF